MKKYFPYDITGSVAIEGEEHTIVHGQIRLDHVPLEGSIEVRGFREGRSVATLQTNEFYCNYRADTLYREANRIVYFWTGRSGQKVYVSYRAVASPVTADDMNEIESRLTGAEKRLNSHDTSFNNTTLLINKVRDNLAVELTKHTIDVVAHSDIRDSITAENRARTNGDASLQNQISAVSGSLATETENRRTADSNLQEQITAVKNDADEEAITRLNADTNLQDQISATNRNLTAETTARTCADETFTSNISSLSSALSTETINRINGDNALDNRIDTLGGALATETSNRAISERDLQISINNVSNALATETSNRTNADNGLQTQIEALAVAFTGATSIAGGMSGLVPAPSAGDESKFLRGDGTWATVSSGSSGDTNSEFTGATSIAGGTNGLVPAPSAGDESKFLRGNGTWDVFGTDSFVPRTSPTAFTIATSAWIENTSETSEFVYYADITVSNLTANDYAEVNFNRTSQSIAATANVCAAGETMAGKIRIYAKSTPSDSISGEYIITKGMA